MKAPRFLKLDERRRTVLFHSVVAVGIVAGAAATIAEIVDRPVLEVGSIRDTRDGSTSRVQVIVKNTSSSTAYCVEVRMGALDGEGYDLQDEIVAEARQGDGRIRPGQSVNFVGALEDISDQEFREELDQFVAYVASETPCD